MEATLDRKQPYTPLVHASVEEVIPAVSHSESQTMRRQQSPEKRMEMLRLEEQEKDIEVRIQGVERQYQRMMRPLRDELAYVRQKMLEIETEDALLDEVAEEGDGPECLKWVAQERFRTLCMIIILANMVVMVLEMLDHDTPEWCKPLDNFFLIWYCFELLVKALYFQKSLLIGKISVVSWNWLDLIIVVTGIFDQWVMYLLSTANVHTQFGFSTLNLRCLRLLRLFRVARALKLLRVFLTSDLKWTEGRVFESFMMCVILANALIMWLELDYPLPVWFWAENVMLAVYVFETSVKMKRLGCNVFFTGPERGWNLLDFGVVLGGIADQWALPVYGLLELQLMGERTSSHESFGHFMKIMRVLRILRVLRLARVLRHIRPLYRLLAGVLEAMQAVAWVLLLTFLLLYSAAIVFTTLVGQGYIYGDGEVPADAAENFSTVSHSLLSLFKLMNDDQGVVASVITTVGGQMLFYSFMMLSNWMMLAILTSVVSDNMISSSQRCQQEDRVALDDATEKIRTDRLLEFFARFDAEQSGRISNKDCQSILHEPALAIELREITEFEKEDLEDMFSCLSKYDGEGEQYLPYMVLINKLRAFHSGASERSLLHLMENMKLMEAATELKLDKALTLLGVDKTEHNLIRTRIATGRRLKVPLTLFSRAASA
mmetsp:Transcript_100742/g.260261  ORF Transcript_100742/g.260261 Transcript_100742/m.260261 type:complete len:660 (-) Transcript_100742:156-2135(-)